MHTFPRQNLSMLRHDLLLEAPLIITYKIKTSSNMNLKLFLQDAFLSTIIRGTLYCH